jgi:cell division septation protein DedD
VHDDAPSVPVKRTLIIEKHAQEIFLIFVLIAFVAIVVLAVRKLNNERKKHFDADGNPLPSSPTPSDGKKGGGGVIETINKYVEGNLSQIEYTHLLGVVVVFIVPIIILIVMILLRQVLGAFYTFVKGMIVIAIIAGIVGGSALYGIQYINNTLLPRFQKHLNSSVDRRNNPGVFAARDIENIDRDITQAEAKIALWNSVVIGLYVVVAITVLIALLALYSKGSEFVKKATNTKEVSDVFKAIGDFFETGYKRVRDIFKRRKTPKDKNEKETKPEQQPTSASTPKPLKEAIKATEGAISPVTDTATQLEDFGKTALLRLEQEKEKVINELNALEGREDMKDRIIELIKKRDTLTEQIKSQENTNKRFNNLND